MSRPAVCAAGAALALAVALAGAAARAYDNLPTPERPRYQDLRFEEDWSALADPEALPARDRFDALKRIPLGEDDRVWLGLGGELRARVQAHDGFAFGGPPGAEDSDVFGLWRLLVHGELHLGPRLRLFAQAKTALITPRDLPGGRDASNTDTLALQNGFLEWHGGWAQRQATVRLGRQELRFGRERLVSPFDWSNVRRTFDGASFVLEGERLRTHAFVTLPVRVQPYDRNDHEDGELFYGVDLAGRLASFRVQTYAYGLRRREVAVAGTRGREDRFTLGGRLAGFVPGSRLDFDVEAAAQLGRVGDDGVAAFMASGEMGRWWSTSRLSPRLFLAVDFASGDGDPGGRVGTFDPLFPNEHRWLGAADVVGRSNVTAVSAGASLQPVPRVRVELQAFRFWRSERSDAWYGASGAVARPASASSARTLGTEIDLTAHVQLDVHTDVGAGYAHFFPGAFVRHSGPHEDVDFFWLWVRFRL